VNNKLKFNIYFSFIEKIFIIFSQFFSSIIIAKHLPREEFGSLAVVAGVFAFLQVFNITFENIVLRDFLKTATNTSKMMSQFLMMNILKVVGLFFLASGVAFYFYFKDGRLLFVYTCLIFFLVMAMDILVSPFVIYASTVFKQKIVTKISIVRWTLNVLFLAPLVLYPTLKILIVKDCLILIVILLLWSVAIKKELHLEILFEKIDWAFFKDGLLRYSLWTHLIGVFSSIIYKADALILYYFVSLEVIGNYNIALTVANVASVLPGILLYQNSVALAHCKEEDEARILTGTMLRLSLYLGGICYLGFIFLGKPFFALITQNNNAELYFYLMYIVSGVLIVKMIISPLVSYINIRGDVKMLFLRVQLPLLILVLLNYILFSFLFGAKGAAISNLVNGLIWLGLILFEIRRYGFKISDMGSFCNDFKKLKKYVKKVRSVHS